MTTQPSESFATSEFKELQFEDGGLYCGGTNRGKAHGHGVCTGPGGEGQYSGAWLEGFESSGSYVWPNGNVYYGQWMQGKRNGLGMERRGHWVYQGEMMNGVMGKYGVKKKENSFSRYEGTWAAGVQCGYGVEVYSDEGSYVGQWLKGLRQGYGIRTSAPFERAATSPQASAGRKFSLTSARSEPELVIKDTDQDARVPPSIVDLFPPTSKDKIPHNTKISPVNRIGFFLKGKPKELSNSDNPTLATKRFSEAFKLNSNKPTSNDVSREIEKPLEEKSGFDSLLSSIGSAHSPKDLIDLQSVPSGAIEVYSGEWKNDKRCGFGISHRSDGLRYEGEWSDNCKNGFGATTFSDDSREEGCYKNNIFQEPSKRLQVLKMGKLKEQVDSAVSSANKAAQIATQKAEIALSRAKTAVSKMEQAIQVVDKSILDSKIAQCQLAAHLEQKRKNSAEQNQNNALRQQQQELDMIQPATNHTLAGSSSLLKANILDDRTHNVLPIKLNRVTKPLLPARRSESFHCINSYNHSSTHSIISRQNSIQALPVINQTATENTPNFYDSNTNLVVFSEKPNTNEVITNKTRRSTLPSIMKYPVNEMQNQVNSRRKIPAVGAFDAILEDEMYENTEEASIASFIVQNGCKKLLSESVSCVNWEPLEELRWDEFPPVRTREKLPSYKLQPKRWPNMSNVRSVPDVSFISKWETRVMPKREAENMCKKVREEKQKLLELEEELRKRAIVIKLGEIKAWCKSHFVEFFILSINVVLAVMFFQLLK